MIPISDLSLEPSQSLPAFEPVVASALIAIMPEKCDSDRLV
jgi:hypothetical protein